jgi:hypothetical protein
MRIEILHTTKYRIKEDEGMKGKHFTEEQIIAVLKETEAGQFSQ